MTTPTNQYEGPDRRSKQEEWHLDKKVPLSLIFAMLVQAAMVIWAIADIKKDTELNKQAIAQLMSKNVEQDGELKDAIKEMGRIQLGASITDVEAASIEEFLKALEGKKEPLVLPQLPASTSKTPKPDIN